MSKFIVGLGWVLSNFAYQYISGDCDYSIAMERSYFQVVAMVAICYLPLKRSK
ncbi:MAG: hypothetical protein ACJASL_000155 [Paraglaciecola sp.]|jgi:hypothetical protein